MENVYDFTGRIELKAGQLVVVPRTNNTSPFMQIGIITRFTNKRIYYKTLDKEFGSPVYSRSKESWTSKATEGFYSKAKKTWVHSKKVFSRVFVLLDDASDTDLEELYQRKSEGFEWIEGFE